MHPFTSWIGFPLSNGFCIIQTNNKSKIVEVAIRAQPIILKKYIYTYTLCIINFVEVNLSVLPGGQIT